MKILQYVKGAKNHFVTITTHKIKVMQGCFKVGLYRQGLLHDLSKYTPTEFFMGAKYYQGTRSPNNAEREDKGYSSAWLHHKGRNKHHYEYWIDYVPHVSKDKPIICGCKMPVRYVVEMFVDRVAACKVYNGAAFKGTDPWQYYHSGRTCELLHPDTRKLLEHLLKMYAKYGEDYTNKYIRSRVLHNNHLERVKIVFTTKRMPKCAECKCEKRGKQ